MVVAPKFVKGDLVVGIAKKHKPSYHMQKGRVVAVLVKHYSVALLEGEAKGSTHKYLHDNVLAHGVSPPHHPAAASGDADAPLGPADAAPPTPTPPRPVEVMTALTELFA